MLFLKKLTEEIILKNSAQESAGKEIRINREIRAQQVRLILDNGENLGVVSLRDALAKAEEIGLDLVEMTAQTDIPVCKIIDFGKYKYELQKKKNEAKKKQKVIEVKEIKLTSMIDSHDYDVKIKNAQRFLADGNKVKWTLRFRGREVTHQDQGLKILQNVCMDLESVAKVDQPPKLEGKQMSMLISPK